MHRDSYCWESARGRISLFHKKKAESLGIVGYVKNQIDGSVFLVAQGDLSNLENLTKMCHLGPKNSIVKSVKKVQKTVENIEGFNIVF